MTTTTTTTEEDEQQQQQQQEAVVVVADPDNNDDDDNDNGNNGNDDDDNSSSSSGSNTVNTDDDEFSDFITSQWKDSVEIGLVVTYPLPSTNYINNLQQQQQQQNQNQQQHELQDGREEDEDEKERNAAEGRSTTTAAPLLSSSLSLSSLPPLTLSTVLPEQSIAPLFDGTQWAGTRIWKAAVLGLEYLIKLRSSSQNQSQSRSQTMHNNNNNINNNNNMSSMLELGCGLGVPGMIWKQLLLHEEKAAQEQNASGNNNGNGNGNDTTARSSDNDSSSSRVVLTDMGSLLSQLQGNIDTNFKKQQDENDDTSTSITSIGIEAKTLDWSKEGITELLQRERELQRDTSTTTATPSSSSSSPSSCLFDICLNCDCVYEPLYGRTAWESLADVLAEVARQSPRTLLVTSLERRNGDNVEGFLKRLEDSGVVQTPIQRVVHHTDDPHHVIEIYVTRGNDE